MGIIQMYMIYIISCAQWMGMEYGWLIRLLSSLVPNDYTQYGRTEDLKRWRWNSNNRWSVCAAATPPPPQQNSAFLVMSWQLIESSCLFKCGDLQSSRFCVAGQSVSSLRQDVRAVWLSSSLTQWNPCTSKAFPMLQASGENLCCWKYWPLKIVRYRTCHMIFAREVL